MCESSWAITYTTQKASGSLRADTPSFRTAPDFPQFRPNLAGFLAERNGVDLIKYGPSPHAARGGIVRGRLGIKTMLLKTKLSYPAEALRKFQSRGRLSNALQAVAVAAALMSIAPAPAQAELFDVALKETRAPVASKALCQKHYWACSRSTSGTLTNDADIIAYARKVNQMVNTRFRQVSDQVQYSRIDHWALPTSRGGDCEDFALLKKQLLIQKGIAPKRLSIATVLDKKRAPHAVLVLRTDSGDLVLDNLHNRMLRWDRTGYSFLKAQDATSRTGWRLVMKGGIFH
ncbi:MAG: transglutaminase-like cysteine peptidase [Dinoroseobacter sp.]|nr:transglutaminase-like cysteine peptidase [Dinoroseobacter sp.]